MEKEATDIERMLKRRKTEETLVCISYCFSIVRFHVKLYCNLAFYWEKNWFYKVTTTKRKGAFLIQ